ncbi:MAG: DUF748 domain-containing protein, partial [Nitrospirota bacterium]
MALGLAVFAGGAALSSRFFLDEQLRRVLERNVNRSLDGYTASIRKLDFHPLGFSLELFGAGIVQDAHPDPPVAYIGRLTASIHWRALLRGRLVADFTFERPSVHLNLRQLREEIREPKERDWQEVLQEIYPLEVNRVEILDGELIYEDEGPFRPLHARDVRFEAENIRNVKSRDRSYPSAFRLESAVFDEGRIAVDGAADFLAAPHPAVKAHLVVERIALEYFEPIARRYHLSLTEGVLSTEGSVEYAPAMKVVELARVTLDHVRLDYIHRAETRAAERTARRKVARAAGKAGNRPGLLLQVDAIEIRDGIIGFNNEAAAPDYRLFLSDADARVENLSNHGGHGPALGTLQGKFMGSGDTVVTAQFLPQGTAAEFDISVRIEGTRLTAMNDVLREHAKFDVVGGVLSLYS